MTSYRVTPGSTPSVTGGVRSMPSRVQKTFAEDVSVMLPSEFRINPSSAPFCLAKRLAKQNGADDGLILNSDGNITETSSANVFWTRDGILRTPPVTDGVLPGVTR